MAHRFEATQALRQTLQRAVSWGMLNSNPAKQGVENRQRPRVEQRPFESWQQIRELADRDIDREARTVYVRRACRSGRLKCPKTDSSMRAVPLQAMALDAIDRLTATTGRALLFPAPPGGYLDLHNFRHRDWKPAQRALGIDPIRRV